MVVNYLANQEDKIFFPLDEYGYLLPPVSGLEDVSKLNRMVLTDIIRECNYLMRDAVIGIYFRGSQLHNTQKSDFDIIVLVNRSCGYTSVELSSYLTSLFQRKYFHINHFDSIVIDCDTLNNDRYLQFIVTVLSIHVYGKQIKENFEGFKPGSGVIFLLKKLQQKKTIVLDKISQTSKPEAFRMSNYIIKYLIRCSFELVVTKEGRFTRELNTCQRLFACYYPAYAQLSQRILSCYNKTGFDLEEFRNDISQFSDILYAEYEKQVTSSESR
jgi:predicted nucleotidyltransferase